MHIPNTLAIAALALASTSSIALAAPTAINRTDVAAPSPTAFASIPIPSITNSKHATHTPTPEKDYEQWELDQDDKANARPTELDQVVTKVIDWLIGEAVGQAEDMALGKAKEGLSKLGNYIENLPPLNTRSWIPEEDMYKDEDEEHYFAYLRGYEHRFPPNLTWAETTREQREFVSEALRNWNVFLLDLLEQPELESEAGMKSRGEGVVAPRAEMHEQGLIPIDLISSILKTIGELALNTTTVIMDVVKEIKELELAGKPTGAEKTADLEKIANGDKKVAENVKLLEPTDITGLIPRAEMHEMQVHRPIPAEFIARLLKLLGQLAIKGTSVILQIAKDIEKVASGSKHADPTTLAHDV